MNLLKLQTIEEKMHVKCYHLMIANLKIKIYMIGLCFLILMNI